MRNLIAVVLFALPFAVQASDLLGLSARIGPSYPIDADVRDATSDVGYNAGLRFRLPVIPALLGTSSGLDLEGFRAEDDEEEINYVGLCYFEQYKFLEAGPFQPYIGLGIGGYRVGVDSDAAPADDGIRVGGRVFAGADIIFGFVVEVSAVYIDKLDEANASTLNLAIGYRL